MDGSLLKFQTKNIGKNEKSFRLSCPGSHVLFPKDMGLEGATAANWAPFLCSDADEIFFQFSLPR